MISSFLSRSGLALLLLAGLSGCSGTKTKITKVDDLPRHTYPVTIKVVDLVTSEQAFAPLAAQVRTDVTSDLNDYDIQDKTTLKNLKGTLLVLDLLEGKNDEARQLITDLRNLEDKPALKLTTGLMAQVRLEVQDETKITDLSNPDFQAAFQKELTARLQDLPWEKVQDVLKQTKGSMEIRSRNLVLGVIQSQLQPAVDKTGSLDNDLADSIINLRSTLVLSLPLKDPTIAALGSVIDAHTTVKPDIWADRAVTLYPSQGYSPVVIGIWDSGVDPSVYPNLLYVDPSKVPAPGTPPPATPPDDLHGIAFDLHSNQVHGDLYPLGDDAKRLPELKSQIKGLLDLQASVDSPEAKDLRAKMSAIPQDGVKPFMEDLELFGNYIHGTHVAGIATDGNPYARILIGRITFDYHLIPEKPTVEQAKKDAAAYQTMVDYFKQHQVRVVNMSWGGSLKDVENALEQNGVGDATERAKEAREIFDIGKKGLYDALQSAPDILFVTAAGNSNNDVNFDEVIPSSLQLPNLITVGAVDQAGDETSFTSFGQNIIAYADGFQVESNIPGGDQLKLSGTSMASPAVANLAAKLIAINPKLKPAEVINLIKIGLDAGHDPRIRLINPKKSVQKLQDQ